MTASANMQDIEHVTRVALVRSVPDSFVRCLKVPRLRDPIDLELARAQHKAYLSALRQCGVRVTVVPADELTPDAPFIEDTAVVLPGRHAVLTNSSVFSRAGEAAGVLPFLETYRTVEVMPAGACLDGGDVLWIGDTLHVGLSERTNEAGVAFLERVAKVARLAVRPLPVQGALHLKSCCSYLGRGILLHAAGKVRRETFPELQLMFASESSGANILPVNGRVIVPAEAARTAQSIEKAGFEVIPVPMSEFLKANGGPTCLSLRIG